MIDIFISRPTILPEIYESSFQAFERFLDSKSIQPRRLGRSDYSRKPPLLGVIDLIKVCKGAIIIGYPQYKIFGHITKAGEEEKVFNFLIPTPWNQIEAALAYQSQIPVMVIAQTDISGGIFDYGVTGEYVLKIDLSKNNWFEEESFQGIFKSWYDDVRLSN